MPLDNNSIQERIKMIMGHYELGPTQFANRIGVSPTTISKIVDGRNAARYETLHKIVSIFTNINTRWLLMGEGKMLDNENGDNPKIAKMQSHIDYLFEQLRQKDKEIERLRRGGEDDELKTKAG